MFESRKCMTFFKVSSLPAGTRREDRGVGVKERWLTEMWPDWQLNRADGWPKQIVKAGLE